MGGGRDSLLPEVEPITELSWASPNLVGPPTPLHLTQEA